MRRCRRRCKHLIGIYQHEKDWNKAIDHARRIEKISGESQGPVIAQFYCEQAEQARAAKNFADAHAHLEHAFESQPECVRAYIVLGHLEMQQGHLDAAAEAFERVATLDVDFVPEVLPPLLDCYARLQQMERAEKFLLDAIERSQGVSPVIALARTVREHARRAGGDRFPDAPAAPAPVGARADDA